MAEDLASLAREHYETKAEIDRLKKRLAELADAIASQAVFPQGKNTANCNAGGVHVKVQRKEVQSWNQDRLNEARLRLGDETFLRLFRFEWKADKRQVDGFLANAPAESRRFVEDALTTKIGYQVSTVLEEA